jgi:hypothetical protein
VIAGGGDVIDGSGGGSGVDGVEDVERAVDEGSGRVEIVVLLLLHRNPSAHFFFLGKFAVVREIGSEIGGGITDIRTWG